MKALLITAHYPGDAIVMVCSCAPFSRRFYVCDT